MNNKQILNDHVLEIESKYNEYLTQTEKRGISYGELAYIQNLSKKELQELEKEIDIELRKEVSTNV